MLTIDQAIQWNPIPDGWRLMHNGEVTVAFEDKCLSLGRPTVGWQYVSGLNGIKTNEHGQPLRHDGSAIPYICIRKRTDIVPAQDKEWLNPWD